MKIDSIFINRVKRFCFTILKHENDSEDAAAEALLQSFIKNKHNVEEGVIFKFAKLKALRMRQGYYIQKHSDSLTDPDVLFKAEKANHENNCPSSDYNYLWDNLQLLSKLQFRVLMIEAIFTEKHQAAKAFMVKLSRAAYNQTLARSRKNMRKLLSASEKEKNQIKFHMYKQRKRFGTENYDCKSDIFFFMDCINIPENNLPKCQWGQHLKGIGRPQNLKNYKQ